MTEPSHTPGEAPPTKASAGMDSLIPLDSDTAMTPMKPRHARLKALAIYALAFCLLGFVLHQIGIEVLIDRLKVLPLSSLVAAFLLINLSQLISAQRMRLYARLRGEDIPLSYAIRLYYLGMFYNLFLPGGFGGDGVKMIALKRHYHLPYTDGFRVMVGERANGLLWLLLSVLIMLPVSAVFALFPAAWLWWALGLIATLVGYRLGNGYVTGESLRHALHCSIYSIGVQGGMLLSAAVLLHAMQVGERLLDYLVLFQISILASLLPFSVGGIGLREAIYYLAGPEINLSVERGVAFSLAFLGLYALSCLIGALFMARMKSSSRNDTY